MIDEPIVAAMLIFALFALGEFLSVVSRARIPMLFVVMFGYLLLLWTGVFPPDIAEKANISAFASILPAVLIVHMGTLIPFKQLKEQYKAVLIALSGILVAVVLVIVFVTPFVGYTSSVVGLGPLTGGIIAFVITSERLQELGLVSLITIPALILGIQNFVGMPLAAYFLRKLGVSVQKELRETGYQRTAATQEKQEKSKKSLLPEKYQTQVILLFQVFLGAAIAVTLGSLTGLNYSLWALAIGIIGTYFGFYQGSMMEKANSFGITMALLIVVVMSSMNSITPSMFTDYLPEVLLIMVVGIIGILIGGYFSSKLFKWNPNKGIPVALTALFGFPGDYIICEEVSRSIGKDEKERKAIFNEILTPMLVGGFTTVTIASIVIASILVGTL
jgi:MFS family permease